MILLLRCIKYLNLEKHKQLTVKSDITTIQSEYQLDNSTLQAFVYSRSYNLTYKLLLRILKKYISMLICIFFLLALMLNYIKDNANFINKSDNKIILTI